MTKRNGGIWGQACPKQRRCFCVFYSILFTLEHHQDIIASAFYIQTCFFLRLRLPVLYPLNPYELNSLWQTMIRMPLYAMGRNPKLFDEPQKYKPERWLRDDTHKSPYHSFSSLPFGFGTRMCIGKKMNLFNE